MATPQPPTRLTVSGGPKVEAHLSQADLRKVKPTPRYYRMQAHRSWPLTISKWLEKWAVLVIFALVALIYLVFDGGVR